MKRTISSRPKMREQALVVDELADEVLVYDRERHQAHCLNQTAALVWKYCDGKTTVEGIARHLQRELDHPVNEELVWLALRQLDQISLLEKPIVLPTQLAGMSRREMVRALGIAAAVAVPLVTSIVAPTAAEAATCLSKNATCSPTIRCCSPLGCDTSPGGHQNKCF